MDEPSEDEAYEILKGLKETYETHHGVTITDGALHSAVKLSKDTSMTDFYLIKPLTSLMRHLQR